VNRGKGCLNVQQLSFKRSDASKWSISSRHCVQRYSLGFRRLDVVFHEKRAALPGLSAALTWWILLSDAFDFHTPTRVLAISLAQVARLTHAPVMSIYLY
jgi:hypothetical protein